MFVGFKPILQRHGVLHSNLETQLNMKARLALGGNLDSQTTAHCCAGNEGSPDTADSRRSSALRIMMATGAAALACTARPQAALAREARQMDLTASEDAEVKEVFKIERSTRLYDVANRRFVSLSELVQPGGILHDADAVCIGELHDSDADHTMQRLIYNALTHQLFLEKQAKQPAALQKRIAVGVEYFSRPQQNVLDTFVFETDRQKQMTGAEFRKACNWDSVWNYDWELYAPFFRLCRFNYSRLLALNLPFEVSLQVSRNGLASLPDWSREALPELDLSKRLHRRRFEDMMRMSVEEAAARMVLPDKDFVPDKKLDKYYESQTLWDEYMAESAERHLRESGGQLLILAGINHVWRDAIPNRLELRSKRSGKPLKAVSVVPWRGSMDEGALPMCADFVWCDACPGGGQEASRAFREQRARLEGKPRTFPAGYI